MCGIAGIFSTKPIETDKIRSMAAIQAHRGPDGEGYYHDLDRCLHLGHRRLSIIDLHTGQQPLKDADEQAVIVYNGEIYNYLEVKKELEGKGIRFLTKSDTEVVLNAYITWGAACLRKFRGMFAFAIWDRRERKLFLARDCIGIKPLHYSLMGETFLFSSELKGLMPYFDEMPPLDFRSLGLYLGWGYIPSPHTIYERCFKLPPGHYLEVCQNDGQLIVQKTKYWDIDLEHPTIRTEKECLSRIEETLGESVKYHMVSDVPVGFYLSGGIDSSLIAAFGSRVSEKKINTFSMGFLEDDYNELPFANEVAKRIASDHYTEILPKESVVNTVKTLVDIYDEPFGDSSALPTYYLSKAIGTRVKVALSGDGGDELWGGYNRYLHTLQYQEGLTRFHNRLKRNIASTLSSIWPIKWKRATVQFFSQSPIQRYVYGMQSFFREEGILNLFNPNYHQVVRPANYLESLLEKHEADNDILNTMQWLDLKTYLPEDCLTKVDRASMANSLEVRVPLLDIEMINLAVQVASSLRVRRNGGYSENSLKYPLRRLARKYTTPAVANRKKKGFSVPLRYWFSDKKLHQLIQSRLRSMDRGGEIFNISYIEKIMGDHLSGRQNHQNRLWLLLVLFEWWSTRRPRLGANGIS